MNDWRWARQVLGRYNIPSSGIHGSDISLARRIESEEYRADIQTNFVAYFALEGMLKLAHEHRYRRPDLAVEIMSIQNWIDILQTGINSGVFGSSTERVISMLREVKEVADESGSEPKLPYYHKY